jgi:hypoxanthine phosphoribosyltransferase
MEASAMSMEQVVSPVPCLLSADQIALRVRELGQEISRDYAGKSPLFVGVLKGAWVFMADLVRQLTIPVHCDFVMLSSYGTGTTSSGQIGLRLDLSTPVAGQDLLIVEDIIDTGHTMPWLIAHLEKRQPASIRLCALLDKPSRRRLPVRIDYLGFTVPDRFIVGYGIDCAEQYRELPYVGYIEEHEPA